VICIRRCSNERYSGANGTKVRSRKDLPSETLLLFGNAEADDLRLQRLLRRENAILVPLVYRTGTDHIAGRVTAAKGLDAGDTIFRAAIRDQVGSVVKRLQRDGTIENIGAGRASKWKLASGV
jgi:hypothetical protein